MRTFVDKLAVSVQACSYFELLICIILLVIAVSIGAKNVKKAEEKEREELKKYYENKSELDRRSGIELEM